MIDKIKNGLNKRKVKLFLVFLLCSSLAWFVSNLGEQYTNNATFDIYYGSTPDSLLLNSVSKRNIKVRLRASGFQFLMFGFKNKTVVVDLSELERRGSKYFVSPLTYRSQIENQLSKFITVVDMDRDTLFFNFQKLYRKKVPVIPKVTIDLDQNYLMDKSYTLLPDSITVIGPKKEIDTLKGISTQALVLPHTTTDVSKKLKLDLPGNLKNTKYSERSVTISAKIFRFSEKVFKVPVEVVNVPEGVEIRTFPEMASVLCRGRSSAIKELSVTDFVVTADYSSLRDKSENILELKLAKKPDSLNMVQLRENKVEFILKRQ
ncbi:YbbR-like domain-containing protein [Arenibacter sp. BSSL-BM3]|uniref:YbbR-like domain-containing protein n=1 Tax=Arenibacter arenosicollis TaxID=2762274 RepID=A0ABR7QQJ5_9FLAO|nr:YbbR-like domain-containing protein [Arenibacter arenosicollis]MBC8769467.1 YbbR-like domain-containing protein [Arenibacter arenosicollis]